VQFNASLQEHEEDERQVAEMQPHLQALRAALADVPMDANELPAAAAQAIAMLSPLMDANLAFMLKHLKHEEDRLSPPLKKNLSIKTMREVVEEVCAALVELRQHEITLGKDTK
jgi:hypothetical protein